MPKPGSPLYVPLTDVPVAHSFGAVMVEGDARLFVPSILPDGSSLSVFERWCTQEAKIIWISELLEKVVGRPVDLTDVAGILSTPEPDDDDDGLVVLYVPSFEMDRARCIPGVHWDRRRKMYVADETADFLLVHRYLTPAMKAAWVSDRNLDLAISGLVKARAILQSSDTGEAAEMERDFD